MQVALDFAQETIEFHVEEGRQVSLCAAVPPPITDPVDAVRLSLDSPFHFPALRRALTPGDHVAVVVDEQLPQVGRLLSPVLQHIVEAGVAPEQVTLLCPPSASRQLWLEELPDELDDVRLEVHDPADRKRLAYLAATREGKRIYLNRTIVEADQSVVLTGRRYDALLGYGGAEGLIYPSLAGAETIADSNAPRQPDRANPTESSVRRQAVEAAWLLGAPFFVQIIEGVGDTIAHVISGVREASEEAERLLDARWRRQSARRISSSQPSPAILLAKPFTISRPPPPAPPDWSSRMVASSFSLAPPGAQRSERMS